MPPKKFAVHTSPAPLGALPAFIESSGNLAPATPLNVSWVSSWGGDLFSQTYFVFAITIATSRSSCHLVDRSYFSRVGRLMVVVD